MPGQHADAPPRFFVYVSDSKLNMLFEQIEPLDRKHISAETRLT